MDYKQIAGDIRNAIKQGDIEKVSNLFEADKSRLLINTPFGTWLHVAASHGKVEIVKLLIALGADVNAIGGIANGGALSLAASEGHIEVCEYLLVHGAELDVSEPERNPLFSAIYGGHINIVKLLIESGIDTQIKYSGSSMIDMDALAFAIERGQNEIAKFISGRSSKA